MLIRPQTAPKQQLRALGACAVVTMMAAMPTADARGRPTFEGVAQVELDLGLAKAFRLPRGPYRTPRQEKAKAVMCNIVADPEEAMSMVTEEGHRYAEASAEYRRTRKRQLPIELLAYWVARSWRWQSGARRCSPLELVEGVDRAYRLRYRGVSERSSAAYEAARARCLNKHQCRAMGVQFGFRPLEVELECQAGPRRKVLAWLETCVRLGWLGLSMSVEELGETLGLKRRRTSQILAEMEDEGILALVPTYRAHQGAAVRDKSIIIPGAAMVSWVKVLRVKALRRDAVIRLCAGREIERYEPELLTEEASAEYAQAVQALEDSQARAEQEKRHLSAPIQSLRDSGLDWYEVFCVRQGMSESEKAREAEEQRQRARDRGAPIGVLRDPTAGERMAQEVGPMTREQLHAAHHAALRYEEYRYVDYCAPEWVQEKRQLALEREEREAQRRRERGLAAPERGELHTCQRLNTPNGERDISSRGAPPRRPESLAEERWSGWYARLRELAVAGPRAPQGAPLPGGGKGPHLAAVAAGGPMGPERVAEIAESWLAQRGHRAKPLARPKAPLPGGGKGPHLAAVAAGGPPSEVSFRSYAEQLLSSLYPPTAGPQGEADIRKAVNG